ncbi:MAG: DUF5615 family PIN-like protein [Rhodopirellula sp.]|nr:DUF5615 family PIN-like protein [Rhodopirellula sp.]
MAELYADEDFSHPVVEQLRRLGHDVLTAQEAGQADQGLADEDVLAFGVSQRRAVVTFNRRHFIELHRRLPSHGGIIVCTRDPDVVALASRIDQAIASRSALSDQLVRINRPQ